MSVLGIEPKSSGRAQAPGVYLLDPVIHKTILDVALFLSDLISDLQGWPYLLSSAFKGQA